MLFEINLILAGLVVGICVGLTSIGLGMIQLPLLLALTTLTPSAAASVGLIQGSLMKWTGMWRSAKKKNIDYSVVLPFVVLGIPFTALGVYMRSYIPADLLKSIIGITMVAMGVMLVSTTWFSQVKIRVQKIIDFCRTHKKSISVIAGIITGFMVGLTSIGSGSFIIIVLSTVLLLPPTIAVGTNLMIGGILVATGGIVSAITSNINYDIVISLLIGSIPGVLIGGKIAPKVPVKPMRAVIAILVIISGLDMAFKIIK